VPTDRKRMNLDQALRDTEYIKTENWGKLLAMSKRQFDEWATRKLAEEGYADFKMVYMPVLMNIKAEGTNNNDLAQFARVTKQAMSKVAKELLELGYIQSRSSKEDKRITIFSLTNRGKKLVIEARRCVKELMDHYRSVFGQKEFDSMLKMMQKIIEYTDQHVMVK
jgi:DNA-binding MarR family transcriptional regulator